MYSNLENITNSVVVDNDSLNDMRLLSINEARRILGIRYQSVIELIENGELEFIDMGSRKKIPMTKLRSFINRSSRALKDKRDITKSFETSSIKNKLNNIIKKHKRS
ncbi:MAG: helix-turn-helix domain-containing protein [Ignavibacteria bacterium]|nr:helix-turn-helix domain-containing protein [Ignavibacteria bacterium]